MKKLLKILLPGILFLLLFMWIKSMSFTSRQISVEPVVKMEIPESSLERFAKGLRFQTISKRDFIDTTEIIAFNSYLDSTFPLADSLLNKTPFNRFSRYYRWQGTNAALKPILLIAHLDVVPVEEGVLDRWTEAPFSGLIKEDKIWGRGAIDDKGNIFSLLEASESLLKEGWQPERSLYLAFGHDEEIGGFDGALAMAEHFKSQGISFEYVLDEGMVILEEGISGIKNPIGLIGIAEKGYLNLRLTAREDGGHSSMPSTENTIGILSEAIYKIQHKPMPAKLEGPVKTMFEYLGPEMSLPFKMLFANTWLTGGLIKKQLAGKPSTNAMLRTTIAPTIINSGVKANVIPSEGYAILNFRLKPGDTKEDVIRHIEKVINDPRIEITPNDEEYRAASLVSSTNTFGFNIIQKSIREIFPDAIVSPSMVVAATDSRHYEIVSDQVYRFMPIQVTTEQISGIHGINEYISVENYYNCIRFYRQLIRNSCQ